MKTIIIDGVSGTWTPAEEPKTNPSLIEQASKFIAEWEGFEPNAYRDPVGIWTIGYGHTAGVRKGDTISQEDAQKLLHKEVSEFMLGARQLVNVQLTNNQLIALTSFAYNLGLGAFGNSTLRRKLNEAKYKDAADQFLRWVYAGGRQLEGLVRRRKAERKLFLTA